MATIRDVAREAGVSIATVSRVFNQSALVRPETCENVREVAARLDYWPNGAARSLITSRTLALGVVLPDLHGEFFSEVIRGIDLAARRERFQILLSSSHADADALNSAVRALRGRIDGLLVLSPDAGSARVVESIASSLPVVLIHSGPDTLACATLAIANHDGALAMTRHLVALGHRRIAMLCGPAGNVDAEERLRGYRAALTEAGLMQDAALELAGDFSEEWGAACVPDLLAIEPRPTAIFCANDAMAIGMVTALRDTGVRVPEEMAVTGFDDIAIGRYLTPQLTTVRADAYELGERAVGMLLPHAQARQPVPAERVSVPTRLIVRASCGAALVPTSDAAQPRRHRPLAAAARREEDGREAAGRDRGRVS